MIQLYRDIVKLRTMRIPSFQGPPSVPEDTETQEKRRARLDFLQKEIATLQEQLRNVKGPEERRGLLTTLFLLMDEELNLDPDLDLENIKTTGLTHFITDEERGLLAARAANDSVPSEDGGKVT